jgi:hypothetical protein
VGSFYYILLVGVCVQMTLGLLPLPCRYSETITVGEWVASRLFSHHNDKAGVVIQVSSAHTPLPIKYNRSYPLSHGYCLTLTTRPLPCRYSETITVGEWVASIIFYW